jgi:hypothetical protein
MTRSLASIVLFLEHKVVFMDIYRSTILKFNCVNRTIRKSIKLLTGSTCTVLEYRNYPSSGAGSQFRRRTVTNHHDVIVGKFTHRVIPMVV